LHVAQNSSFLTAVEFYGQRENYRIYPESRPSRLDWNGWLSVDGVQVLATACSFRTLCFRLLLAVSVCLFSHG
jgi:hypothetical protein